MNVRPIIAGLAVVLPLVAVTAAPVRAWVAPLPLGPAAAISEMTPEMARAFIVGIQEQLAAAGYQPGPADGIMGRRTEAAIRRYQSDAGLPVDGIASSELLDHMKFVEPKVRAKGPPPPLAGLVVHVQEQLALRGYYGDVIDGLDGRLTRAAVRRFQTDAGLPVTGTLDERLLEELRVAPPEIVADPAQ